MLAIVIPYFKLFFFEKTLQSLADQTNKNFKVYIGNDNSLENPEELLNNYKNKINFKYKKFEINLGGTSLVKQWDRCIELVEDEEWIMILGDDDYLENTVIESWYKAYNIFVNKSYVIRFASIVIDEQKGILSKKYEHPLWEKATESYYRNFKNLTRSSLSEYIFSKKMYKEKGFKKYPLAWCSDDQAWLDFSNNKPIFTINDAVLYIRISDLSISGKDNNYLTKLKSLNLFYKNNIENRLNEYPKELQLHFLKYYEIYLKMDKTLESKDWFFLLKKYLSVFSFIPFLKFIRRFLIYKTKL